MEEIKQNGKRILWTETGGLEMIWNNIIGKFMPADKHRHYLDCVAYERGFRPGQVEFWKNGQMVDKYTIQ